MNTVVVAKGRVHSFPLQIGKGRIELNGIMIELPAVLFEFWRQFQEPCSLNEARLSFVETGLPIELFDRSIELLKKEELLEITTK